MPKKQKVNKTQAVKDYLKSHPGAVSSEIATALVKQGVKITPNYVANIKTTLKAKRGVKEAAVAQSVVAVPKVEPAPAAVEKPSNGASTITIEQIKAVAGAVKVVGGADRLNELLGLVKAVGGLKKFKELVDAITS